MNPKPLMEWAVENDSNQSIIHKEGYWRQINFLLDIIVPLFAKNKKEILSLYSRVMVIGSFRLHSAVLPVYQFTASRIQFTLRCNFNRWIVSVNSEFDINADFLGIFDENKVLNPVYCIGIPGYLIFESFRQSRQQFTIELRDNYFLFTFYWILRHHLLNRDE